MHILLVSQYFWPETFRINDLAISLLERGNEVTVLTGKPNYPQGKIYNGYSFWGYTKENYKGINIIRVPLAPRVNGSGKYLALNYVSFVFFSCIYILFHRKKYDVSLTFALSPITSVYPAILHKVLYKTKTTMWVQDLWPESVSAAGKMSNKFIMNLLNSMVRNIYRNTDEIFIQSEAFEQSIKSKGVSPTKLHYIPNWAEDLFTDKRQINETKYKGIIPKGFIVMFAGNIGEAQDFDSIIKAAIQTKDNVEIKWVIIGDGRKKKEVEKIIKEKGLTETVFLLGRYPVEEMPNLFTHADLMLVSLKDEEIFSLTIPSKIQSYMAFGKPIVSMLNGIGNKIIKEADCGYNATAGNYKKLADNVILAANTDRKILESKGNNGMQFYKENFSKEKVIDNLLSFLN